MSNDFNKIRQNILDVIQSNRGVTEIEEAIFLNNSKSIRDATFNDNSVLEALAGREETAHMVLSPPPPQFQQQYPMLIQTRG